DLAGLKTGLAAERAALRERFGENGDAAAVLRGSCRLVDRLLRDLWGRLSMPPKFALLAVGGYGRGELYPHSDIDVLGLPPADPSGEDAAKVEEFIGALWDSGLEAGHSVRTVPDCVEEAAKDVTVRTSLLEARLLTGDGALFDEFHASARAALQPPAFFK